MKRSFCVLLAALVMFGFSACGPVPSSSSAAGSAAVPAASAPKPPDELPQMPQQPEDINPLTGLARPETLPKDQRPVAVMVANNLAAFPQRGITAADIIVETVTEGGITRLMALFSDYNAMPDVGPVRSTRDQFVQFAVPANAVLAHIGSSVYAGNLLTVLNYRALDGLHIGAHAFYFDSARAVPKPEGKRNEYCWYTSGSLVANGLAFTGITSTGEVPPLFYFSSEEPVAETSAYSLALSYSPQTFVWLNYNASSGLYYKSAFGVTHTDESGQPLTFTNLILLQTQITHKADGVVSEFKLDEGTGYYCSYGDVQPIIWKKGDPTHPLLLFDENGDVLQVDKGRSYIGILPAEPEAIAVYSSKDIDEMVAQAEAEAAEAEAAQAAAEAEAARQAEAEAAQAASEPPPAEAPAP